MRSASSGTGNHFAQLCLTVIGVIACAVLAGFWATRLLAGSSFPIPPRVGTPVALDGADPLDRLETSAPLFGSRRPGGPSPNVLALGVISDANGAGGAIIVVAGQPPRAVRVGDRIEGRLVTAIDSKGVTLEGSAQRDSVPIVDHPRPGAATASLGNAPAPPRSPPGYVAPQLLGTPQDQGASMEIPPLDNEGAPEKR